MISKELIDRFLKNDCTAEEWKLVNDFLAQHPEELDACLPAEECVEAGETEKPGHEISVKMWSVVRSKTTGTKRIGKLIWWSAAAVLLGGMVVAGIQLSGVREQPVVAEQGGVIEKAVPDSWKEHVNTTNHMLVVSLPDGSTAALQPKSSIRYASSFENSPERTIQLTGEVMFKVTGHTERPFMVHSGGIITKVLGTSFVVRALDKSEEIRVRLYTGKVVVNVIQSGKDIYLRPGQELVYDEQSMLATVGTFAEMRNTAAGTTDGKPDWYQFNGQSLSQVFDQLGEYYHVEIDYRPADLLDMYFAARFEKQDTLDKILADIALLNNLSVKKQGNRYTIRKHH